MERKAIFCRSFQGKQFPFAKRNWELQKRYNYGFVVKDFFQEYNIGIITKRDKIAIGLDKCELEKRLSEFAACEITQLHSKFDLPKDTDWVAANAHADLNNHGLDSQLFRQISHTPFDLRWTYYSGKTRGLMARPVWDTMRHMLQPNIGFKFTRMTADNFSVFCSKHLSMHKSASRYDGTYIAPLYLYPEEQDLDQTRQVNFDPKLWKKLREKAMHGKRQVPNELETFDYIYGVLHCPTYHKTYAEFLKIDFPRIPWPKTPDEFWSVSDKGSQLRKLHLMKDEAIGETPYPFDGEGDSIVDKPSFKDGKVWINKTQFFVDVPKISWEFFIGGYQPAQKWLKDRKSRTLSFDDIRHYQKIIKILSETDRVMKTITMTL